MILDFDGTIAETERFGHRVAYNLAFTELGLDWHWSEELYGDLLKVAGGKERLGYYVARYRPELLERPETSGLIAEIYRAKVRHFRTIAPGIPLRLGVQRLVYEAHLAGLRVAIATTASKNGVEALLSQDPALLPMIGLIAAGDAVERKKPAPDIYQWALARLGLRPEACVAIEDSNIGLRAALAAGLATVITVSDYTKDEDFSGAAAVLSDLGESDLPARSIEGVAPAQGVVDLPFLQSILSAGAQA